MTMPMTGSEPARRAAGTNVRQRDAETPHPSLMAVLDLRRELRREPPGRRIHHVLGLRLVGVEHVVDVVGALHDVERLVKGPGRVELVLGLRPDVVVTAVDPE